MEFLFYVDGQLTKTQKPMELIVPLRPVSFVHGSTQIAFDIQGLHVGSLVVGVNSSDPVLERSVCLRALSVFLPILEQW